MGSVISESIFKVAISPKKNLLSYKFFAVILYYLALKNTKTAKSFQA